jgi:hypothetical protein
MLPLPPDMNLLDKMVLAVRRVRDRLERASRTLKSTGIPFAITGDQAVAAWVATIDAAAVRNTQDVDILLRRSDLDAAAHALESAGFIRRNVAGMDIFLDGPDAKVREAVHIVIASEKFRPEHLIQAPDIINTVAPGGFPVVSLEALVQMKLTSLRDKDKTHLRDLLEIGLIDETWPARFAPQLAARLQQLIDTPDQ